MTRAWWVVAAARVVRPSNRNKNIFPSHSFLKKHRFLRTDAEQRAPIQVDESHAHNDVLSHAFPLFTGGGASEC